MIIKSISIHAPASGATGGAADTATGSMEFQSTLPRVERRHRICCIQWILPISIHAPASGATDKYTFYDGQIYISIHAPASGAT